MRETLYRKYRPKKLADVIGQEPITKTLSNALKQKSIRHAYLFTGPRGVGKTSVARILAHEINDLPYDDDKTHLDIIEIDAASNRKIDEVRDLREKVNIAPTSAPYKVYIIDEVHMLTKEAFNALLKTLEEPPEHVIFILATTEAHKLPATIISRTQRFPFRQIANDVLVAHLSDIAKKENISIEPQALEAIAARSEGSVRDALSLLDQVAAFGNDIDLATTLTLLGLPSAEHIEKVITALQGKDVAKVIEATQNLRVDGVAASQFAAQLGETLRQRITENNSPLPHEQTIKLLRDLLEVGTFSEPMSALEVALIEAVLAENEPPKPEITKPPLQQEHAEEISVTASSHEENKAAPEKKRAPKTPETAKAALTEVQQKQENGEFDWNSVLINLKGSYSSLYGLLRMAEVDMQDSTLTLTFRFPFHAKQLQQAKNIERLKEALNNPTIEIVTAVNPDIVPVENVEINDIKSTADKDSDIQTVSNIFGDVELLD